MAGQVRAAAAQLAAAKAAQINAKLMAKGVPLKQEVLLPKQPQGLRNSTSRFQLMQTNVVMSAEIEINDLDTRGLILKSNIQDQIGQWTGTTLVTRGRYIQKHKTTNLLAKLEKPLFIHISAVNKDWQVIEKAVHFVLAVLKTNTVPRGSKYEGYVNPVLMKICHRDLEESTIPFVERVPCSMSDQVLPWNIKSLIEGPDGSYIQHVTSSTQARIILRGELSGNIEPETNRELPEPLFMQINHSTMEGLVEATQLVESLLFTVHEKVRAKRNAPGPEGMQTSGATTGQMSTSYPRKEAIQYPGAAPMKLTGYPGGPANPGSSYPSKRSSSSSYPDSSRPKVSGFDRGPRGSGNVPTMDRSFPRRSAPSESPPSGTNQRQVMNHVLTLKGDMSRDFRNHEDAGRPDNRKSRFSDLDESPRGPPKRRFQENFNASKKKKSQRDDQFKMPPPPAPTVPISAGNVSDWIKETHDNNRGRSRYDKTLVCSYSDSDED